MKKLIDAYIYRINEEGETEHLIFLRAKKKIYAHQWRMIGGKVKDGETYWHAALREIWEETALVPDLFWTVPSVNHFYEHSTDSIHLIPAFAACFDDTQTLDLNAEHTEYRWIKSSEIDDYIHWPEQIRLMQTIDSILKKGVILENWIIEKRLSEDEKKAK